MLHLVAAIFWLISVDMVKLTYVGLYTFFIFGASIHVIYMDMFAYVSEFCIKKLPLFGNNNNMRLKTCVTKLWNISTIFLLFALAPYMMIIILLRYFNICYGDLALHSHSQNDCPAHIGVWFALNMYGITHALIALKMLRFPEAYPIIYFENKLFGGFLIYLYHSWSLFTCIMVIVYKIINIFDIFHIVFTVCRNLQYGRFNTFNTSRICRSLIGLCSTAWSNSHGLHKPSMSYRDASLLSFVLAII